MKKHNISIIGLGLIGCSLSIALRKSGFADSVIGMDKSPEHQTQALEQGYVDSIVDFEQACQADIVIVATPVDKSADIILQALNISSDKTIIVDVGSTKKNIVEKISSHPSFTRFVPSHPMAGTENSGPLSAENDLFTGRTVILLPFEQTAKEMLDTVKEMWESAGAKIVYMSPEKHDMSVAYVSHISHISSYALALTVLNKERSQENITSLAAGGFDSTARLAKSHADMWEPIFLENKDAVIDVIDEYIENMILFKHAIKSGNAEVIRTLIRQANKVRDILDKKK